MTYYQYICHSTIEVNYHVLLNSIFLIMHGIFYNADWLWLLSGFVHLTLSTFIGYRGGKRNKSSWIAFFGTVQGILAVLLALINASDHYNFQRPSALMLATPGNQCTQINTTK